ncbi:MAG: protein kinase domain-containing protein [Ktedonobacteraceae bacterium]
MQTETLPAGTILHGRYRIERALGSGGFGHVYLSVDLQTQMQYAIKEYIVTGTSGKAQLEHEAQVLNQLHHPNLPAYLAAFDERGHYYVVLGYIEGNDLTDYVRAVRQKNEVVPIARLMEWVLSIGDAIAFLHSQHPPIIHRDIKPDNIRITPSGTAMLVDLGNAKTAADGARTLFFIRHQGTPGYAPLEQYPGGTGTDERSDIYALGGTLYFALTAQEPPNVSVRNQSMQQKQPDLPSLRELLAQNPPNVPPEPKLFRLGHSKPAKPVPRHSRHLAQLETLSPELLQKLDTIIHRAMAMRPQDRYQTVTALGQDLKSVLKALPASTMPTVAKGRSAEVDIHSTQPDLPMLYEALQTVPNPDQAAPAQPMPKQQAQPVVPTPAKLSLRCQRCGTELTRLAPYCPYCGNPTPQPGQPKNQNPSDTPHTNQGTHQPYGEQDISDMQTQLVPPQLSPLDPTKQTLRSTTPSTQAAPWPASGPTPPALMNAHQHMLKTSSQPMPAIVRANSSYPAPTQTDQTGIRVNVKPFMTAIPAPQPSQIPASPRPDPSPMLDNSQDRQRRIIVTLIMVIVAVSIVALLLLAFLHNLHRLAFNIWTHSVPLSMYALEKNI